MKEVRNPWDFSAPTYDNRSGNSVNAGNRFGVGKRNPIGCKTISNKGAIPTGCYRKDANEVIKNQNPTDY